MLTWNDVLDIELRNKGNPDVEVLIEALRADGHPATLPPDSWDPPPGDDDEE